MDDVINIVVSYAREDQRHLEGLILHLTPLERSNKIRLWYDGLIQAGQRWDEEIIKNLEQADIILLLVSADFLVSDFVYEVEVQRALERHSEGKAIVVPIILRPCDWSSTPFGDLQALPRNARPVSMWESQDEAYVDIIRGLISLIDRIEAKKDYQERAVNVTQSTVERQYKLEEVFVSSGLPSITFVEPEEYKYIKHSLSQKGRGIVIEGPSGIGKTTTAIKVLESKNKSYTLLSARLQDHLDQIQTIAEWHKGVVIIDDFHRLDISIQTEIVNYLKYLADFSQADRKLIIIGIPNTGNSLIKISFDLANRITIFKLGISGEKIIEELINKGEKALNIEFLEKASLIREAYGSLYIAQLLCAYTALINGVEETLANKQIIQEGVFNVIERIKKDLAPKFDDIVRHFASIGGRKNKICIEVLKEIALTEEGILNFYHLKSKRPELKAGIEKILVNKDIQKLYQDYPECKRHLLFDERMPALIIDDPQFKFYLNNISIDRLILLTGKISDSERTKVFISYSHNDEDWLKEVLLHLKHLERKGIVDLWVDKRIKAGQNWRREIDAALKVTKVGILLVSQNFLASDFIAYNELPPLLESVEQEDATILQIVLKPCSLNHFPELSKFQTVNDPKYPLAGMNEVERAETLVRLAEVVEEALNE